MGKRRIRIKGQKPSDVPEAVVFPEKEPWPYEKEEDLPEGDPSEMNLFAGDSDIYRDVPRRTLNLTGRGEHRAPFPPIEGVTGNVARGVRIVPSPLPPHSTTEAALNSLSISVENEFDDLHSLGGPRTRVLRSSQYVLDMRVRVTGSFPSENLSRVNSNIATIITALLRGGNITIDYNG